MADRSKGEPNKSIRKMQEKAARDERAARDAKAQPRHTKNVFRRAVTDRGKTLPGLNGKKE